MTITRDVPEGTKTLTIELTSNELSQAYYEQEHIFDVADVRLEIEDGHLDTDAGYTPELVEKYIDEIASRKRKYIDDYGMDWRDAVQEAIKDVLDENMDTNDED